MIDSVCLVADVSTTLIAAKPMLSAPDSVVVPFFAQAAAAPMLDPPTRAVLLMALLAFLILGLGLIAGAMLGGRWVRRLGGDGLTKPLALRRGGEGGSAMDAPGSRTSPVVGPNWNRHGDTTRLDAPAAETRVV